MVTGVPEPGTVFVVRCDQNVSPPVTNGGAIVTWPPPAAMPVAPWSVPTPMTSEEVLVVVKVAVGGPDAPLAGVATAVRTVDALLNVITVIDPGLALLNLALTDVLL